MISSGTIPTLATTTPTTITYRTGLQADIYVPASPTGAVVLIAHVGGFTSTGASKTDTACVNLAKGLNAVGIIAVSYDYTPATGAGLALGQFPRAILDTLQIARWCYWNIRAYGGDRTRIGAVGLSAGGNLVAMAALAMSSATYTLGNGTSLVESGAPFAQVPGEASLIARWAWYYGISDLRPYSTISPGNANPTNVLTYLQCSSSADPNYAPRAADASPILLAHSGTTQPYWMGHGTSDIVVDPAQSTTMASGRTTLVTSGAHLFDPVGSGGELAANLTIWAGGNNPFTGFGSLFGGL